MKHCYQKKMDLYQILSMYAKLLYPQNYEQLEKDAKNNREKSETSKDTKNNRNKCMTKNQQMQKITKNKIFSKNKFKENDNYTRLKDRNRHSDLSEKIRDKEEESVAEKCTNIDLDDGNRKM